MTQVDSEPISFRPPDMGEHQDHIIQHVAEYVVNSRNSAAYFQKLCEKTKHNPNFNFLSPAHPHYAYYEFLVSSYQQWKHNSAYQQTGSDEVYGTYQAAGQQQQQQQHYPQAMSSPASSSYPTQHEAQPSVSAPAFPTPSLADDDDDEEDNYELVEVNGVKKLVPRRT